MVFLRRNHICSKVMLCVTFSATRTCFSCSFEPTYKSLSECSIYSKNILFFIWNKFNFVSSWFCLVLEKHPVWYHTKALLIGTIKWSRDLSNWLVSSIIFERIAFTLLNLCIVQAKNLAGEPFRGNSGLSINTTWYECSHHRNKNKM